MSKQFVINLVKMAVVFLLFVLVVLFVNTIAQYTSFDKTTGFLAFKQTVVNNSLWRLCFYLHIFSVVFCLFAGFTQFSQSFFVQYRKAHKLLGRIYVYNIVLINFPVALLLGIFSNGGILGALGFVFQDLLWLYFTVFAVVYAKQKRMTKHRNFMILSYAITTTAITFRIIKYLFYSEKTFNYELFYGLNVWAALILNLMAASIIMKISEMKIISEYEYS